MRIVVTGGAGRIGGFVVVELRAAGHEVVSFDRAAPPQRVAGVTYRIGDHEDLGQLVEVCAGADAVVHLAAIAAPGEHPNATVFRTNTLGTFNVHEAAMLTGVPLVVSTSSGSAYGFAWWHRPFYPHALPLDEDAPCLSQDAYGLSKMVGEEIAHAAHRRSGLRVCSLRPPMVLFPDTSPAWLPALLDHPEDWHAHFFTYVDARDLAMAYRLVVEAPETAFADAVYNVNADDALAREPLATLLPRVDPAFRPLVKHLADGQPLISAARFQRQFGWSARHRWRDMLAAADEAGEAER
jgi:nucleoside-diphosphate-sugar epimerase